MATIILSAVGTAVGGPIGGSIGALIGSQIDQAIFKPGGREAARLKELKVTTSSYGTSIARHYGKVRTAGSVIWATDLMESREKSGGGKGKPSVTSYSYSASFAVALASRPIRDIGRIWADGNLLRGASGDLKAGGELRIYNGHGDQPVDALIASDKGECCPAFRGLAYCVFENLQLGEFGNRIPALTFEVIADDGEVSLAGLIEDSGAKADIDRSLDALVGYSEEGGPISSSLEAIDQVYPFCCDASGDGLTISAGDTIPENPVELPPAIADSSGQGFGAASGQSRRRQPDARSIPDGLRYYDLSRDFQAGLQRADGRARSGRSQIIEFPGTLDANDARKLANAAAERANWSREVVSWRIAELDPALAPGQVVRIPAKTGLWRIQSWEWRENGVELELHRLPHGKSRSVASDAGAALPPADLVATPTSLVAYELPWDGTGSGTQRQVFAAASAATSGWAGAAIYADNDGSLEPIAHTGKTRSIIGTLANNLPPSGFALLDRQTTIAVDLASDDFLLTSSTLAGLAGGSNRALVGEEIFQFASASRVSAGRWELRGLLRGRGGTEAAAMAGHRAGASFVLLDERPVAIAADDIGATSAIAATGLADAEPVAAPIIGSGKTTRPLTPVLPRVTQDEGGLALSWTRRSRASWEWRDLVDVALNEAAEIYRIGVGPVDLPAAQWETKTTSLQIDAITLAELRADHAGQPIWVRQLGGQSASDPLHLYTIA